MIKDSPKVLLSLFVGQFAIAIPIQSAPKVYLASWHLLYPMTECVDDAYKIAKKHQFTDDQELINDADGELKTLYATHKTGKFSIVIKCSRGDRTASYAVGGYDNGQTYKMYSDINDSYKEL